MKKKNLKNKSIPYLQWIDYFVKTLRKIFEGTAHVIASLNRQYLKNVRIYLNRYIRNLSKGDGCNYTNLIYSYIPEEICNKKPPTTLTSTKRIKEEQSESYQKASITEYEWTNKYTLPLKETFKHNNK